VLYTRTARTLSSFASRWYRLVSKIWFCFSVIDSGSGRSFFRVLDIFHTSTPSIRLSLPLFTHPISSLLDTPLPTTEGKVKALPILRLGSESWAPFYVLSLRPLYFLTSSAFTTSFSYLVSSSFFALAVLPVPSCLPFTRASERPTRSAPAQTNSSTTSSASTVFLRTLQR